MKLSCTVNDLQITASEFDASLLAEKKALFIKDFIRSKICINNKILNYSGCIVSHECEDMPRKGQQLAIFWVVALCRVKVYQCFMY
jgi:hypothetical protein